MTKTRADSGEARGVRQPCCRFSQRGLPRWSVASRLAHEKRQQAAAVHGLRQTTIEAGLFKFKITDNKLKI